MEIILVIIVTIITLSVVLTNFYKNLTRCSIPLLKQEKTIHINHIIP